jgi:ferritin-like metal-binding protein YciE
MNERQDTLQQYVSDMLAVEKHILQAIERQRDDEKVRKYPETLQLIGKIEGTLRGNITGLEQQLKSLNGDGFSPVKEAVTSALGVAAGMIDMVRTNKVSKMLRDDYTALSLAAVSYTMLHTTGLALEDNSTAEVALRNLKSHTPLIAEISEKIAAVVVDELRDESEVVNSSVAPDATRNTQEAWDGDHVHSGHNHSW